ncbi:hypothetical protein B0A52_01010 [Exophiala mesophila]|uniref:Pre-mRNA-splicing factor SPF27 n=1 Tax=Exophiala mesophila TaxID=212818 RepID=A0A438NG77_EXOME|nr:hypothetical protein B0A52_01010 [Exophiala mesophila]
MPLILESQGSLPYIDGDLSPHERSTALNLINRELPDDHLSKAHPSLAPLPEVQFSEAFSTEIERAGAKQPMQGGIDVSRYEAQDDPAADTDEDAWRQHLRSAYISSMYLLGRQANLDLLDEYGKNAWLVSNSQMEYILQDLEQELDRVKNEIETVNKARKQAQEQSKGELLALDETWKSGIGKILEIQVATDNLRQLILESRRNLGQAPR